MGLSLASAACAVIPTASGACGVYASTSAAKATAGAEPPPEGIPDATPPTPYDRGGGMNSATLTVRQDLMRRLDTLARRTGLTTTMLAHLFLEAAVNQAEQQVARDRRVVKDLEAVLVRAILKGEYDPATSGTPR
jgi:hypothetical protein